MIFFIEVFNKAMEVSGQTNGIYDITCAPFINLWGFGFSKSDSVTPAMIDSIRPFVGYQKVRLEGRKVIKDDPPPSAELFLFGRRMLLRSHRPPLRQ